MNTYLYDDWPRQGDGSISSTAYSECSISMSDPLSSLTRPIPLAALTFVMNVTTGSRRRADSFSVHYISPSSDNFD